MQKSIHNSSDFTDQLRPLQACPVCNKEYEELQAVLLDHCDDTHLVHIECPDCKSRVAALLVESQLGLTSLALRTELSAEEILDTHSRKKIEIQDILDVYDSLHEGKFCKQLMLRSYGNESSNSR